MGDKWMQGYDTSSSEEEEEKKDNNKKNAEEEEDQAERDGDGKIIVIELDKNELYQ